MINITILSNDSSYVNNIRSKCFERGLEVEHLESSTKLITYLAVHKRGIVLLDIRHSSKIVSVIYNEFIKNNCFDFKFIFMEDFSKSFIEIDNVHSFSATASNILEVLDDISFGTNYLLINSINDYELKLKISNTLNKLNLPASVKGYNYLLEGIKYAIRNYSHNISITSVLLPYLSNLFNESVVNIEKCARVAVKHIVNNQNEEFKKIFGHNRITVKTFIVLISNHIISILYQN